MNKKLHTEKKRTLERVSYCEHKGLLSQHVESSLNFDKGNIKIVESNICKMEQFNPLKNHAESQQ